jgi:PST family polysaccharide transporter
LQRALAFRRLFIIDVISYLFGYALVASIGAMYGLGVWSLVLGSLAQALIASGLSIVMTRAPIRPLFAMAELRELLGFGMGVSISGIAAYCGRTGDNFMVGRLLGPAALGFYARAFNLMMLPLNYVCSALPNVLIPIFARLQHDRARVGRGFLLSVQATGLVIAPVMAGLAVAAPHMIIGLYGERWSPVVVPLQILCSVGLPRAVVSLAGAVNRTCGGVYAELRLQVLFAAAVLASASIGSERGVAGVALLVSASILCMYAATTRIALRATSQAWRAFGAAHLPGIFLGLFTAGLTCGLRLVLERTDLSHLSIFLLLALAAGLSVPVGIYLLPSFLRPTELLLAVRQAGARLPGSLRGGLMFLLRLPV